MSTYITFCVKERDLATSTIETRVAALRAWHRRQSAELQLMGLPVPADPLDSSAVADLLTAVRRRHGKPAVGRRPLSKTEFERVFSHGFDLSSAHGLHHRLCLMLLTLGCLRRVAAAHLRVFYRLEGAKVVFEEQSDVKVLYDDTEGMFYLRLRVNVDKNVREREEVYAYVPSAFRNLSARPVDVLLDYLRRVRPPSGSYLLAAPRSARLPAVGFHSTPYRGMCAAFKRAVQAAFPRATPELVTRVGSHSGRKSLAQWLWDAYASLRLICDVGHWKSSGDAVSLYFVSSRHVILRCLASL